MDASSKVLEALSWITKEPESFFPPIPIRTSVKIYSGKNKLDFYIDYS